MKVSWVLLTWNRRETVQESIRHNFLNAGAEIDEVVYVDNGSTDWTPIMVQGELKPETQVLHNKNQGAAKGYNRAMSLATGDIIVITGCDMLMPDNWLRIFKEYLTAIPNTGAASMYQTHHDNVPERLKGEQTTLNGLPIVPAMPMGRKAFSRDFLRKVGYLREDFNLYGWEDVEWGHRCERVAKENGLINYVIPNKICRHLGKEQDTEEYKKWKQEQASDPRVLDLMKWCHDNNFPYYNPYL